MGESSRERKEVIIKTIKSSCNSAELSISFQKLFILVKVNSRKKITLRCNVSWLSISIIALVCPIH